jgi:hypothetical protein
MVRAVLALRLGRSRCRNRALDYTLNTLGVIERRDWANKVLAKLLPEIRDEQRIVMFAGHRYREFLVEPLLRHGFKVEVPMAHLTRGEQLAWLSAAK